MLAQFRFCLANHFLQPRDIGAEAVSGADLFSQFALQRCDMLRYFLGQLRLGVSTAELDAELARVDPVTAARLAPGDSQRIQRALEVWQVSGRPLSSFHTIKTIADSASPISAGALFSLEPDNRAWLHERIAQRFDAMLASGFVDEVRALRARGDLHADLPSMRCVGYRQVWEELDFQATRPEGTPLNTALLRERGIAATRQLAKRQITWLRGMPQRHTIACDRPTAVADLVHAVLARLDGGAP